MTYQNGKSFFSLEDPEENNYLDQKRIEIETMDDREKMVARTVLLVGETLCLILTKMDHEVLQILKQEIDGLFNQANDILKDGTHKGN